MAKQKRTPRTPRVVDANVVPAEASADNTPVIKRGKKKSPLTMLHDCLKDNMAASVAVMTIGDYKKLKKITMEVLPFAPNNIFIPDKKALNMYHEQFGAELTLAFAAWALDCTEKYIIPDRAEQEQKIFDVKRYLSAHLIIVREHREIPRVLSKLQSQNLAIEDNPTFVAFLAALMKEAKLDGVIIGSKTILKASEYARIERAVNTVPAPLYLDQVSEPLLSLCHAKYGAIKAALLAIWATRNIENNKASADYLERNLVLLDNDTDIPDAQFADFVVFLRDTLPVTEQMTYDDFDNMVDTAKEICIPNEVRIPTITSKFLLQLQKMFDSQTVLAFAFWAEAHEEISTSDVRSYLNNRIDLADDDQIAETAHG